MNIKIITLHRVTNFGSLLQTYATQKVLTDLGHYSEIIDFQPVGLSFYRAVWPARGTYIIKVIKLLPNLICNLFQFNMSNSFIRKNIIMTEQKFTRYSDLEKANLTADIFITGSDQVWNTQNANEPDDLKAYFLCFVGNNSKKISYASSFGRDDFSDKEKEKIGKWLRAYDSISVREDTGLDVLSNLGITKGRHVVDPTLLVNPDQWLSFCNCKPPRSGYVFVYNLNRNKVVEEIAIKIANKKKIHIINFADTFEFIRGANNRINNKPEDFIKYIAFADYVVTDSFHGTAFSINFNKEFISVPAPKYNSRILSVLRMVDLDKERYISNVEDGMTAIERPIDWKTVNMKLNQKKKESLDYLVEALASE